MHVCKKCGNEFDGIFCPHCGEKWIEEVCPRCGEKLEEGARFCPKCGYSLLNNQGAPVPAAAPDDPVKESKVRTYKILYYLPYFVTCVVCALFFAWYALPVYTDPFGIGFKGESVYELFVPSGGSSDWMGSYITSYLLLMFTAVFTLSTIIITVRAFTNPKSKGVKPLNAAILGIIASIINIVIMSNMAVENSKVGMANGGCVIASLLFACLLIVFLVSMLLITRYYKKKNIAYLSDIKIERD